ncbi:MAG TPA: Gfo/Idh/MocA family oxidoreductase, partial [Chthoniobacterales bacterium]
EVREETGLHIQVGSLLGVLDRRDKDAIALLFAAIPNKRPSKAKRKMALESGRMLCLTHCYTGYPMVRQARALVREGAIGRVRLIEAELSAGDPGVVAEPKDSSQRHWRFRKSSMGEGAILGEVGSHPFNLACFVSGLKAIRLCARMSTVVANREVYDNAHLSLDYEDGVQGRLWASYVAAGNDQGLCFRIFGEKGWLTWYQE